MSVRRREVGWAIGQAVRKARKAAGLTQVAVARRVGIDLQYLSMIELGKRASSIAIIFAVAEAIGIKPGELVTFVPTDAAWIG